MALFYHIQNNFQKAAPLYNEALQMYRRLLKNNHPDLATSISNTAHFYNEIGNLKKQLHYTRKLLTYIKIYWKTIFQLYPKRKKMLSGIPFRIILNILTALLLKPTNKIHQYYQICITTAYTQKH